MAAAVLCHVFLRLLADAMADLGDRGLPSPYSSAGVGAGVTEKVDAEAGGVCAGPWNTVTPAPSPTPSAHGQDHLCTRRTAAKFRMKSGYNASETRRTKRLYEI